MSIASNVLLQQQQQAMLVAYLNQLYKGKEQAKFAAPSLEHTQGYVRDDSMCELIARMHLHPDDVFIDIGSGSGRVVLHAFLQSPVKKAIGIEIASPLHLLAQKKKQRLLTELPLFFEEGRNLQFIEGDFLTTAFQDATVAFISAVCFSQTTLIKLAAKLNQAPTLRAIFSLKPLTHLHSLPFKRVLRIHCSWGSALCYWYEGGIRNS